MITGSIIKIAGPVIVGSGMKGTQMHEMVNRRLPTKRS